MNEKQPELSPEEIDAITGFWGYGRKSARVWFIGFEEGLAGLSDRDQARNLKVRGSFEKVMDLYRAHLRLYENDRPINLAEKIPGTPVWKYIAKIMLARSGRSDWRAGELIKCYIRSKLARDAEDSDTFLTELSPIPKARTNHSLLVRQLAALDCNLHEKIEQRNRQISKFLHEKPPQLVICYGRSRAADFARLLGVEWNNTVHPKISRSADSRCLLLPFLGRPISHSVIEALIQGADLG